MNPKLRAMLAIGAGIVAGAIVIGLVEMLSAHTPPPEIDLNNPTQVGEWMKTLPTSAFAIILLAYFLGSAVGGWVTNRICAPTKYRPAIVVGFGLFVAGLMNLLAVPHPLWFSIASSLTYFIGAWIGGRAANRATG